MSVFSKKFKKIAKRATAWSLTALTALTGVSSLPSVAMQTYAATNVLSDTDRGVIFANSRTDFRDESIYFAMVTRFYNGDESNDTQCWDGTQYNLNDPAWRGDFKGLIEKLDYIKALGFTAIWITPVVENCSGYDYHGYHAINFSKVDPRYESDDCTYQDLIDAVHAKGMKIIQDVVFNHTGNFGETNLMPMFTKEGDLSSTDCLKIAPNSVLPDNYEELTPDQQYQARLALMKNTDGQDHDTQNLYHHYGNFNWDDYTCQIAQIAGDCVDLNTENPIVYNYLVDAYTQYIDMGVDAFRVDTVRHISRLTFNKVFNDAFKKAGAKNGKDFFMFGEVCCRDNGNYWYRQSPSMSTPYYTWKDSKDYAWSDTDWEVNYNSAIQSTLDNADNISEQPTSTNALLNGNEYHAVDYSMKSGLDVIDFPMHWSFKTAQNAFNVAVNGDKYYNDATWNVTYVDSHDYAPDGAPESERFNQDQSTWAENLSLMFTFRGIPCIYYGTEIEFKKGAIIDKGPHIALEDSGRAYYGDNIEGNIDTSDFGVYGNVSGAVAETMKYPLLQHIQRLNRLRQAIPALRKGQYSTEGVSGSLAFKRRYTDNTTDSFVCVAVSNSATFTGIPNGKYVDAVTGDVKNVTNGTLSVSVSGKGNLKAYVLDTAKTPAPGRVITNGTYLTDGGAIEDITPVDIDIDIVDVTGISLDKKTVTVQEAETAKVTATVAPSNATNKSVKWTSSNESVATVTGGTIKGISVGTATITATTNNGKTATVKVTVTENTSIVKPTGITLSPTSLTITEGQTDTLTATVAPSNATDKSVKWTSSNTSVATVNASGKVTAVSEGAATITATTSNGKTATATVTVEARQIEQIEGIYFEKPSSWGSKVNVYIYDSATDSTVGTAWPGRAMTDSGDGIYTYEFTSDSSTLRLVFNDGSNQAPSSQGFEFKNNGYYNASGFVKVVEKTEKVDVTSVTLSAASATLNVGDTKSLTATVSPSNATNKTITWTSSNPSVATVNASGTVTAVSAGTATITATSNNGKTATAAITVKADTPSTLVNNSTLSAASIGLGSTVTAKAAATGGTGSYTYAVYYRRANTTSWTTAQAYASNANVTIKPLAATDYEVCIKVKDSAGTEVKKYLTLKVTNSALTNNSTLSATSISLGGTVTAKAVATGGTGSYTYAVYYRRANTTSWTTAQTYASNANVTIKPLAATTYEVCIKVKDSAGTEAKKYLTLKVTNSALINNSKISAASIKLGDTITATGAATGGSGSYTYAFYYKKTSDTKWTEKQTYSSTKTVAIKPAHSTTYQVCIKVKDSKGTIEKKYFDLSVTKALANNSTISATSITLGNTITATGAATGGSGSYTYAFYYKKTSDTKWTEKQTYSSTKMVTIKPAHSTTYQVCIKVKDSKGTIEKKYFDLTVKSASTLVNNSTVSATSVSKGSSVTVKCAASKGTSPYTYKIERMAAGSSSWTTVSNSTTASINVSIPSATVYNIRVTVTDAKGATAVKYFTVTGK